MGKSKIFVIMPFEDKFFEVYEMIKIQFNKDFDFSNAGEEGNQQNILKDIIQPIFEADIIIADLTDLNSNVLYELGIAHSFNKKTIIITQNDLSSLPFDLKQYRAKDYTTHFKKFAELIEYLNTNLNGAVSGEISFSNPVNDFLSLKKIESPNLFSVKNKILIEESEKGFLDYMADIEEDVNTLANDISNITFEMENMTSGVSKSTSEIEKASKTGGSGTASFVRKEAKKVAKYVDTFSSKLHEHNNKMSSLWNNIEKNSLGLLESKFVSTEDNKPHLIDFLKSLREIQKGILENRTSIIGLKDSMHNIIGFERSMNQAIKFVEEDLGAYLTILEQMNSSIDRILEKSKFVVGMIDFSRMETK